MDFSRQDKVCFDKALHKAVTAFRPDASVACNSYALLGAMALNHIIGGRVDFVPHGGGRQVRTSPGDDNGPYSLILDPKVMTDGKQEFHFWIMRISTEELIDFTSRYIRSDAEQRGLPWQRGPMPKFLWGNGEKIQDEYDIAYWPEENVNREIQKTFLSYSKDGMPAEFRSCLIEVLKVYVELGGNRKEIGEAMSREQARGR